MAWSPLIDLYGSFDHVRVGASDAAQEQFCGLQLALKVRPSVGSPAWRPRRQQAPFALGPIRNIALRAHDESLPTYADLRNYLDTQMSLWPQIHPCLRLYTRTAVEGYLDAHEALEAQTGPLRLVQEDPEHAVGTRSLHVWAPVYGSEDGTVLEVRKVRFGAARAPGPGDLRWGHVAVRVIARTVSGPAPVRLRAVEVGLEDGSFEVLFDGTPAEADAAYEADTQGHVLAFVDATHTEPGYSCGSCKVGGACDRPVPVDGMLGTTGPGNGTRPVSPSQMATYATCPAQWLLRHEVHVPQEQFGSDEPLARGIRVHEWLQAAHDRGVPCGLGDLPDPDAGGGIGLAASVMDEDAYRRDRPYLLAHLSLCPLGVPGATDARSEGLVVGYDSTADVMVTTKPDLLYRLADRLVVRETKSTEQAIPQDRDEAYDRYPQVAWALQLLRSGLADRDGATGGLVELEVLTTGGGQVFAWATDEPGVPLMAAGDVRRAVAGWHTDTTWATNPAPHCAFCPVRRWCPDRDTYAAGPAPAPGTPEAGAVAGFTAADDDPPF